ncbi:MarR family winged helix-turn-helix transcriptional regulator [Solihabitans fulvus]|nr:MarR family transcriptional regulator [Solihabitans fulvus]
MRGVRDAVDMIIEQWRTQRPGIGPEPIGVVGRVSRLESLLGKGIADNFAKHGLGPWEFDVLATLRRAGEPFVRTVGSLQGSMMISSGTMTHRLDRLEQRALVGRAPDPNDRRGVLVRLTPEGLALVDEVVVTHLATERTLLAGLTQAEQDQLAALLRTLLLHLGDTAPE